MQVRKRLFLGALLFFTLLVSGLGLLLWYFTFREPSQFFRQLFFSLGLLLFLGVLLVLGGLVGIVFSIITGKSYPILRRPTQFVITHLLPLVIRFGKLFHIAKERVELSFIEVNNALVRAQMRKG